MSFFAQLGALFADRVFRTRRNPGTDAYQPGPLAALGGYDLCTLIPQHPTDDFDDSSVTGRVDTVSAVILDRF